MQNRIIKIVLVGLLVSGLGGAAQATTWKCDLNKTGKHNWVPRWIVFSDNDAAGKVVTTDNVTRALGDKKPVLAKEIVNNDKRLTFKWRTGRAGGRNTAGQAGYVFFDMRATFLRTKRMVVMYIKPRGYANDESTRGKCAPVK